MSHSRTGRASGRLQLPAWLTPAVTRAIHLSARWMRPLTLGVRAAIFDETGRVFLVKHSYVRGWHLPGGAVESGETVSDALRREIREETGLEITGEPTLHGVFFNRRVSRRDHVLVYAVRDFTMREALSGGLEIVDRGFFPPSALPADATRATRVGSTNCCTALRAMPTGNSRSSGPYLPVRTAFLSPRLRFDGTSDAAQGTE